MRNKAYQPKILIIDDEVEIAELLTTVLIREGFTNVYSSYTAQEGVASFKRVMPDLVLLDIMLPDGDGYELFTVLRQIKSVPILFVSAKDEEVDRLLGFAIGADDYITKPFSPKEVAYRVKARLREQLTGINQSMAELERQINKIYEFGKIQIDTSACQVKVDGKAVEFTAKEFKLLLYFVENPNRILSKEMICRAVWGEDFIGYDNTISVHIRKIRLKIEEDPSTPKWIITVIGLGYKFNRSQEVL